MSSTRYASIAIAFSVALAACGGSGGGSGSGPGGRYVSVSSDSLIMELGSGGKVTMTAVGAGSSQGTYTVDGEKVIVTIEGQAHTLIRDGDCLADQQDVFGKMCKGGKAGAASNVTTRQIPAAPSGTWLASSADGQFKLEFGAGTSVALTATPPSGAPDTRSGSYRVEGDEVYITLSGGEPLVLKFVNSSYESTSFGFPMKFTKQ